MKKYQPSVKANNALKEDIVKELKALLYKMEKGKYKGKIDSEVVKEAYDSLKEMLANIDGILFTGEENVGATAEKVFISLDNVKKQLDQDFVNRLSEALDDATYYLDGFTAIGNGAIDELDESEEKAKKVSWARKKLNRKLDELREIKETFVAQEKRLEKEIQGYETDLQELEEMMVNESNERKINELYRKITANKSKLDMLNVRRSNYSACFNILDIIYANAQEIITASEFSMEELGKAKALLNIDRLKNVVSEPDKAVAILKHMEKDIKAISEKVKGLDEKVFGLNTEQTSVTDSALKYKEELMRKKREKELGAESLDSLEKGIKIEDKKVDITEEN